MCHFLKRMWYRGWYAVYRWLDDKNVPFTLFRQSLFLLAIACIIFVIAVVLFLERGSLSITVMIGIAGALSTAFITMGITLPDPPLDYGVKPIPSLRRPISPTGLFEEVVTVSPVASPVAGLTSKQGEPILTRMVRTSPRLHPPQPAAPPVPEDADVFQGHSFSVAADVHRSASRTSVADPTSPRPLPPAPAEESETTTSESAPIGETPESEDSGMSEVTARSDPGRAVEGPLTRSRALSQQNIHIPDRLYQEELQRTSSADRVRQRRQAAVQSPLSMSVSGDKSKRPKKS